MENFQSVFGDKVLEAYKLYSEYFFYIKNDQRAPTIGVKVLVDLNGTFGYSLSHHYQGRKQAGAYTSSHNHCFENERAALEGAKSEAFSFYDANDLDAVWIPNPMYNIELV